MKTDNHKENGEGCYKKMIHRRENWMAGKTWKNVQPYHSNNKKLIHKDIIKKLKVWQYQVLII